jgi:hypothetical protein
MARTNGTTQTQTGNVFQDIKTAVAFTNNSRESRRAFQNTERINKYEEEFLRLKATLVLEQISGHYFSCH